MVRRGVIVAGAAVVGGHERQARPSASRTQRRRRSERRAVRPTRSGPIGMVDRYLVALAANDPSGLPLAAAARFTENGRQLELGEGLWRAASGIPDHDYAYVEDDEAGQIGWLGVVDEGGRAAVLSLRLRVRERPDRGDRDDRAPRGDRACMTRRTWTGCGLSSSTRSIRRSALRARFLAAIGHGYFDGIEQLDAGLIAIREDCLRIENGSQTVLLDDVSAFAGSTAELIFPMSVREQVRSGYVAYIDAVRDRRVVAVDESRGLVAMVVVFDHPARVHSVAVSGIGEVALPEYHRSPNSMLIAELFKIRAQDGSSTSRPVLEAIPFEAPTGW